MYLLYVDHSGELLTAGEKYFVMAGVGVFERQVYFLEHELDDLQSAHCREAGARVEFHASVIRAHDEAPWNAMDRVEREEIISSVYRTIANSHNPGLYLFGQAIEKAMIVPGFEQLLGDALDRKKGAEQKVKLTKGEERRQARQDEAKAKEECRSLIRPILARGIEGLCTQFELFLRRFYDQAKPESQQRGLMIFDHASYEREAGMLVEQFRAAGTGAVGQLYNIIEGPMFADSASTRMLQLADFVSHAVFRRYETGDTRYFDGIANRFDEHGGIVHGLAHITSESAVCMCPGCFSRRTARRVSIT